MLEDNRIIDFHTHCYNEVLAKRARERVANSVKVTPHFDCTLNGLKATMQKTGIDISVLLNIANRPDTTKNVNDWAISCNEQEGIVAFGSVHPFGDYLDELKRLRDSGIKGIKLHPYYQNFFVNDSKPLHLYEQILKMGFVLIFHCGIDMLIPGEFCTPRLFVDVVNNFEGEKIVAAHLCGTGYFEDAANLIFGKNIYLDTSIAYLFLNEVQRKTLFDMHSADRILFATDMPWGDPVATLELIKTTVPKENLQKILYKNAAELLSL